MTDQGPYGNPPQRPGPPPEWREPSGPSGPQGPPPRPPQNQFAQRPQAPQIPDFLVWAILLTLFCCQPLGLWSTVLAARSNGKKSAGDYHGALEDGQKAKKIFFIGLGIGVVAITLYVLLYVVLIAGSIAIGDSTSSSSDF